MCIIVIKEKGLDLPKKSILQNCFNNNPDGCGYMYSDGNEVHIRKGFMTFSTFEKDYDNINEKVDLKNHTVVYHFRISTQAGVNRACTHPYPLSNNMKNLKKLYLRCDIGIAHNGVIQLTSSFKESDHNDTMEFITDYLSLIIKDDKFYEDKDKIKLIERLCGSKLAILDKNGHCTRINGSNTEWVYDKKTGLYFSNHSYVEQTFKFGNYKVNSKNSYFNKWYGYDDDLDDNDYDEDNKAIYYTTVMKYNGKEYRVSEDDFWEQEGLSNDGKSTYYSASAYDTETLEDVTLLIEVGDDNSETIIDVYH